MACVIALGPYAHLAFHEHEARCEACPRPDLPVIVAGCEGPCGDPGHHHHEPGDRQHHCPACLLKHAPFVVGLAPTFTQPTDGWRLCEPGLGPAPALTRQYRIDPQRGPPAGLTTI